MKNTVDTDQCVYVDTLVCVSVSVQTNVSVSVQTHICAGADQRVCVGADQRVCAKKRMKFDRMEGDFQESIYRDVSFGSAWVLSAVQAQSTSLLSIERSRNAAPHDVRLFFDQKSSHTHLK